MVRIIDGEIVQDDDPRLQARQRTGNTRSQTQQQQFVAARGPRPATPTAAPAQPIGFDWSAPAFRAIPNEFGSSLPDVEIYGLRVPGVGLVAVAAAGFIFGWRGLLGGFLIGYLYLTYGQNAPAPAGQRPAGTAPAGGQGFAQQQGFQNPLAGAFGGGDRQQFGAAGGPGEARQRSGAKPGSPWSGKGRKLGSS